MPHRLRIIICCYCGARSTLKAEGGQRLVCHGCGAPVKRIEAVARKPMPGPGASAGPKPATPHRAEAPGQHHWKDRPARRKKGKRKRGGVLYRLREALDDLDDIFDIFD